MTEPAWQYYGGKTEMRSWLYDHFPPPGKTFVDACGGSGAVLLGMTQCWPVEVFNDVDEALVCFFRVARDRPEELAVSLLLTPYARSEFDASVDRVLADDGDELSLARDYATVARMSGNGIWGKSWSRVIEHCRRNMSSSVSRWMHLPEDVLAIAGRIAQVQIENMSVWSLIRDYDRPDTFFYVDPPYPETVAKQGYRYGMTEKQQVMMLTACRSAEAKVAISSYRNALYDQMLAGWRVEEREVSCRSNVKQSGENGDRPTRIEALYMNY